MYLPEWFLWLILAVAYAPIWVPVVTAILATWLWRRGNRGVAGFVIGSGCTAMAVLALIYFGSGY